MSDATDQSAGGHSATMWIAIAVVVVILYLLSPAPVLKAVVTHYGHSPPRELEKWFGVVYAPLEPLIVRGPQPVRSFYEWWFDVWDLK